MELLKLTLEEIISAANNIVGTYLAHRENNDKKRKGCFLAIVDTHDCHSLTLRFGKINSSRYDWLFAQAKETADKLVFWHNQDNYTHSTQGQTQTEESESCAIVAGQYVLACSGFSQEVCEAIVFRLAEALQLEIADHDRADLQICINTNQWHPKLAARQTKI